MPDYLFELFVVKRCMMKDGAMSTAAETSKMSGRGQGVVDGERTMATKDCNHFPCWVPKPSVDQTMALLWLGAAINVSDIMTVPQWAVVRVGSDGGRVKEAAATPQLAAEVRSALSRRWFDKPFMANGGKHAKIVA
jgi:hypothetical protein